MIVIPANTNVPPMVSPPSVIMRINHNTRFNDLPPLFVLVLHVVVVIVQTTPTVLLKRRWKREENLMMEFHLTKERKKSKLESKEKN